MSTRLKKEVVADLSAKVSARQVSRLPATAICDAVPGPVVVFDKKTRLHYANYAAQEFWGISARNISGLNLSQLFDKHTPVLDALATVLASGNALTLHDIRIGDRVAASLFLLPLPEMEFFMLAMYLQHAQAMTEWAEKARLALKPAQLMARTLAHEIKNPLAGIRAAAQLLSRAKMGKDDRELLDLITYETGRLAKLVEKVNIFDEAPRENGPLLNIHEVLDHVAKLARASFTGIVIREKYDPSLPEVRGCFDPLVQAVLNLVKNAVEAECAVVTIRTFYDTAAVVRPTHLHKLPICIEVRDDGRGIDPDALSCMFDPYFTTKPEGEGLGLSIVSKIVDDHGGTIDVASEPGKTVFRISLPMVKP